VRALDRRILHGIDDAERRDDFTARKRLDLELVAGRRRDALADRFGATENRVETAREARRSIPFLL
jgi:hypothetical protein